MSQAQQRLDELGNWSCQNKQHYRHALDGRPSTGPVGRSSAVKQKRSFRPATGPRII
jgi:hypothetical protein